MRCLLDVPYHRVWPRVTERALVLTSLPHSWDDGALVLALVLVL